MSNPMEAINALLAEQERYSNMSYTEKRIYDFSKTHDVKNGVLSEVWESLSDEVKLYIVDLSRELEDFYAWQENVHEWHQRMP